MRACMSHLPASTSCDLRLTCCRSPARACRVPERELAGRGLAVGAVLVLEALELLAPLQELIVGAALGIAHVLLELDLRDRGAALLAREVAKDEAAEHALRIGCGGGLQHP